MRGGTVTIGEALEATAISIGDKPVDRKDAAAIQTAETRATGGKTVPGGVAATAQAVATLNERNIESRVTISDVLTVMPITKTVSRVEFLIWVEGFCVMWYIVFIGYGRMPWISF
ncbi:PREDICTED: late embryogenesis abundant protein 3 [Tarenaya hassleriana]|uniref:late embryogenesis abundant protein 3 n=1 Tax=Tarenaya hassleriana TaxID=28532 RepID=UPI0008FCFD98|nr:PREDICTED: late embryogenesis abundant protein 3 [Tarenaya hassleriana]